MIICLTDQIIPESVFDLASTFLVENYGAKISQDVAEASLIITDNVVGLSESKKIKSILYICSQDGSPFNETNLFLRRQLQARTEVDVFCASMYLARMVNANYNIRAKIQYPYICQQQISDQKFIIYNKYCHMIEALQQELPAEQFVQYDNLQDFSMGKLYLHLPDFDEASNVTIPTAASYGVPTVTIDRGCISELISSGDLLLPKSVSVKQLIQGVKVAMRDRNDNSNRVREASKKFSNLDFLVEKRKKEVEKKAINKTEANVDKMQFRSAQAISKRVNKKLPPALQPHQVVYSREPYVKPNAKVLPVPKWFNGNSVDREIDVSIIVPMFRSTHEITEQIRKWDTADDGLVKEIIYVSDACPHNSANFVLAAWEERGTTYPVGKIIELDNNSGFATACNEGAKFASGRYVVFLNADTVVTKNWLRPMVELQQAEDAGIVGNMQLKDDNCIDSAGSEWMWDSMTFEHVGRNVYQGKRLSNMMKLSEAPEDLLVPQERDMVTGCCMLMKKELFDSVNQFDVGYRIGYWEDSDINMKVKVKGYKVFYQPNSRIYHKTGHSRASLHPFIMDNARYFYDKWVNNHLIDSLVKAKRPSRV